jgi:hypothetical protein
MMSKHRKSNKEQKKQPLMTAKEKRAAKRDKDATNNLVVTAIDNGKSHHQKGPQ